MKQYKIQKNNKRTGFTETIIYTGLLRDKPKGWKVIEVIGEVK